MTKLFSSTLGVLALASASAWAQDTMPPQGSPRSPTPTPVPDVVPAPGSQPPADPGTPALPSPDDQRKPIAGDPIAGDVDLTFRATDRNGDGLLSLAEADRDPTIRGNFAKLDADGDGTLTPDEFRLRGSVATRAPGSAGSVPDTAAGGAGTDAQVAEFARLDINGDGQLSQSEVGGQADIGVRFRELDRDGDGTIDREEFNVRLEPRGTRRVP